MRDSRFEVTRIFAMLFVVLAHFSLYEPWKTSGLSVLGLTQIYFYRPFGQIGVYLFVLISAYFMSTKIPTLKQSISRSKKVWLETFFYSTVIVLIYTLVTKDIHPRLILTSFFPFFLNAYWFVTAYIMLVLLLPFVNKLLSTISKKEYQYLLLLSSIFTLILPPIFNTVASDTHGFLILFTIYLIGAYLKKYNVTIRSKWLFISMFLSLVAFYISMNLLYRLGVNFSRVDTFGYGVLPAIFAVSLFILIKQRKPFHSRIINLMAGNVFSVYLITVHPAIQSLIFTKIFNVAKIQGYHPPYLLAVGLVIAIFLVLVSCLIDSLRKIIFKMLHSVFLKFHIAN
ncbi:MAG: acyltransferase [Oenococcus sp.]|uniref:acyltransferase family protein n=1 Tax=Oenococcus sp. TaxID=1979414 RepID=UPI0039EB7978